MKYLDTSLVVAALATEPMSPVAARWLVKQPMGSLVVSDWVLTEFAAALSLKVRAGEMDERERAVATHALGTLVDETFTLMPIQRDVFRAAADLAARPSSTLRAGDALHVALVIEHGMSLHTLDGDQAANARRVGVAAELVRITK